MAVTQVTNSREFYKLTADPVPAFPAAEHNLGDLLVNSDSQTEEWRYTLVGFVQRPVINSVPKITVDSTSIIPPAMSIYLDWFHGTDATPVVLPAGSASPGVWLDMREINTAHRSIVLLNGNASPDYAYNIYFSRNGTSAAQYLVKAVGAGAQLQQIQEVLDAATYGYDQYVKVEIIPTVGQTGTQLDFQVYLAGRGG